MNILQLAALLRVKDAFKQSSCAIINFILEGFSFCKTHYKFI